MNPLARMVRALHDRLTRGGTQARRQIRALGLHERALRDIIRSLEIARGHLSDRVNESMATTESEVLAAGGAITRVVAHARSQAAALAALARALSSSASGETASRRPS